MRASCSLFTDIDAWKDWPGLREAWPVSRRNHRWAMFGAHWFMGIASVTVVHIRDLNLSPKIWINANLDFDKSTNIFLGNYQHNVMTITH